MRRKISAVFASLAILLTSFGLVSVGNPAVAGAQAGCVDLGWHMGAYHAWHGVRCGNHDTWEFYGPQGQYGGVGFHYWWPAHLVGNMWTSQAIIHYANAPACWKWQWADAAPGYTHKGWTSVHGYAGDLQVVVPSIVNVVNWQTEISCHSTIYLT